MARIHGRKGRLYAGVASGGTAEPIAFLSRWSLDSSVDFPDVTAFGDGSRTYLAGLPDASGSFTGFYDDASAQLYTASTDGVARKVYLYPTTDATGTYWFGTAFFDNTVETPVDGAVTVSGNFRAATTFLKVG